MAERKPFRIVVVVAARPNMMKVAPILAEMARHSDLEALLVHTGQHYDYLMSQVFFEQLNLPEPYRNLEVGGGSHHQQTGEVIKRFGEFVQEVKPDCIVVAGDVNATVACALVAAKEHVALVHVESGLRSGDRQMPEEINRIVTDAISDLLLVTEKSGMENLQSEGVPSERVVMTGNVMIDSLSRMLPEARKSDVLVRMGLRPDHYVLLTLHRPSNVDNPEHFRQTMNAVADLGERIPVVFPVHPRTAQQMRDLGFSRFHAVEGAQKIGEKGLWTTPPAAYKDFVAMMDSAAFVVTDSGGIQEETSFLGVPCLTYRENTERPVTVENGSNVLIGTDPKRLLNEALALLESKQRRTTKIPMWDGHAAERIVVAIRTMLNGRSGASKL
jgi:UDP-N-acetylglucosamine 2-epimerase (non-hydrolysing)